MEHTDTELEVSGQTGAHHVQHDDDIFVLVGIIKEVQLFKHQPGREFAAFPGFKRNLLSKLSSRELWNWMRAKIKEWRKKYQFKHHSVGWTLYCTLTVNSYFNLYILTAMVFKKNFILVLLYVVYIKTMLIGTEKTH